MLPDHFEEILEGHCFVPNLDRCPKRWELIKDRLQDAGFTPKRIASIDGYTLTDRRKKIIDLGFRSDFEDKFDSDGQCGSFLTHISIWEHIVQNNIPFASIFEDDILIHKDWHQLAPKFYERTDKNIDIIFYGSQGGAKPTQSMILSHPVFCIHAFLITLDGAKKLLNALRSSPKLYVLDCMTIDLMHKSNQCPFQWQCWNATMYEDSARHNTLEVRNDGLVFQDEDFPSDIHAMCQNK